MDFNQGILVDRDFTYHWGQAPVIGKSEKMGFYFVFCIINRTFARGIEQY